MDEWEIVPAVSTDVGITYVNEPITINDDYLGTPKDINELNNDEGKADMILALPIEVKQCMTPVITEVVVPIIKRRAIHALTSQMFWSHTAFALLKFTATTDWRINVICTSVSMGILLLQNRRYIYDVYRFYKI